MNEINNINNVKKLVDTFYEKVRKDTLLAPIFEKRIKDQWPEHLEKMYRFWQTILLDEHTYQGSPFTPHVTMLLKEEHFSRWITLFKETINENFTGEKALEAKARASNMARMFEYKIDYLQKIKAAEAKQS
tara:strand:+ start:500 stop:892 length:393 start_codon:yes stop_codon:yes gene_type:complete